MTGVSTMRPSDARREALKNADAEMGSGKGVPLVSNFFPIERYYSAADKVLESFEHSYADRRLDEAYVYGKRFMAFSIEALPNHNYYRLPKYAKWRKKNDADMKSVISRLEQVATWMDAEEVERQRVYQEQLKLHQEQIKRQKEAERKKMMELQLKIQQRKKERKSNNESTLATSALSKLQQLSTMYPTDNKKDDRPTIEQKEEEEEVSKDGSTRSFPLPDYDAISSSSLKSNTSALAASFRSDSLPSVSASDSMSLLLDTNGSADDLPPPIPPPPTTTQEATLGFRLPNANELFPPPPSYNHIMASQHQPPPPSYNQAVPSSDASVSNGWPLAAPAGGSAAPIHDDQVVVKRPLQPAKRIPIRKLRDKYTNEYKRLKQEQKIVVFGLDTYQGRYRTSTNGCTVISPLVVSQHLRSSHAVSNDAIVHVIDTLCGPILRDIRAKLDLQGDALIIPSDVHDYMVDHKILSQDKFVGASGGNILDDAHLDEFLKLLSAGEKNKHTNKKSGAALFFREHVVSIVKVPNGKSSFFYDLVDSMPASFTRMATRTRCKGIKALKSLLKWYACSHFSDSNLAYIDQNAWDECMADFDPRVFQAFVWADI